MALRWCHGDQLVDIGEQIRLPAVLVLNIAVQDDTCQIQSDFHQRQLHLLDCLWLVVRLAGVKDEQIRRYQRLTAEA
ncbi:hypothetical protein D3C75_1080030 [compost metagenome]